MAARTKRNDALTLLKKDHNEAKDLFEEFEETGDSSRRFEIARKVIEALKLHSTVEEELFYPALRKAGANGIMEEADEEHHVAKLLIAELELMKGSEENFSAKFLVLAENVRHHIKEEEKEIFAKAKESGIDLELLGEKLLERKEALKSSGVPTAPEEEMIKNAGLLESPAKRAARDFQLPSA